MLEKGLGHGTIEFLKTIWYPAVGNFNHLFPEWEVRDFGNRYRYLDLAYRPSGSKGCIEIHGYRSHARDIEAWRFKDLCMKQAYLCLDEWMFLPIEDEALRFARGRMRTFTVAELAEHLNRSNRQSRRILEKLVQSHEVVVVDSKMRYRTFVAVANDL